MSEILANASSPPTLDAAGIASLIPHHGSMCLLDSVQYYDALSIKCSAQSHRLPTNPLREQGRLHAVCGVEYAAQAMAIHGALLASRSTASPRGGRLAALRSLDMHVARLDDIDAELQIVATQVMGDGNNMIYAFSIHAECRPLLSGKATVVLMPDPQES
ncbi:MAG: hydroxymyristoyl-ACP dehydratase [Polaromonas sp.]|nr:hydroxymyristoyl-ACP dehydratase [Polaromonas sp.]